MRLYSTFFFLIFHLPGLLYWCSPRKFKRTAPRINKFTISGEQLEFTALEERLLKIIWELHCFGMDSDNDFTFCQVGSPGNQDALETKKLASDMDAITIKDDLLNGTISCQNSGSMWKGGLRRGATSEKRETVGSLSVTVIDASSTNQYSQFPKQQPSRDAGKSVKPVSRAKIPFEKGYSQMDWLKLTRTHPDLAGLKGQSNKRLISMSEVKQHQKGDSMWTVLKGRVYNLSPYMRFHPGGVDILKKAVGKDCTSLFNKYHAWVNADFLLEKCLVGTLDDGEGQQHSKP